MNDSNFRSDRRRGATIALLTAGLALFLIPLIGLAIDGTMCYIVQSKLSSATDGAALGAGRLLGTNANTDEIAGEFLRVNFPTGFWGTRNLNPTIQTTRALGSYTIRINATVEVPLLFLRVIGKTYSLVAAAAVATRRDTRVVLVLDRSGSMDNTDPVSGLHVFTTMKTSAASFVGMFTPGSDELGLVVYSGSTIVAYPTARPYNTDPHSAGGPDASFATSSSAGVVFNQISALQEGGGTNISEALSIAYLELQKAHYRALATNGVDNSLNAIVLFTDGVPSALSVAPNDPANNSLKSTSTCSYNPATAAAASKMKGWIAAPGSPPYSTNSGSAVGFYRLSLYDNSRTLTSWLQNPTADQVTVDPSTSVNGCADMGTGDHMTDMARIPPFDYNGNSTNGTGYTTSTLAYTGVAYNNTRPSYAYHVGMAAWNASDNAGKTIRTQAVTNPVAIYTIGYTGNGGTDAALLKRLANTLDSTSYNANEQSGLFVQVNRADQLAAAFQAVASDLLRLAQ